MNIYTRQIVKLATEFTNEGETAHTAIEKVSRLFPDSAKRMNRAEAITELDRRMSGRAK